MAVVLCKGSCSCSCNCMFGLKCSCSCSYSAIVVVVVSNVSFQLSFLTHHYIHIPLSASFLRVTPHTSYIFITLCVYLHLSNLLLYALGPSIVWFCTSTCECLHIRWQEELTDVHRETRLPENMVLLIFLLLSNFISLIRTVEFGASPVIK